MSDIDVFRHCLMVPCATRAPSLSPSPGSLHRPRLASLKFAIVYPLPFFTVHNFLHFLFHL